MKLSLLMGFIKHALEMIISALYDFLSHHLIIYTAKQVQLTSGRYDAAGSDGNANRPAEIGQL